jgi:hypothetical protein
MPGHDSYIIQVFDVAVDPEDKQARAAEIVNLLAQGLLRKFTRKNEKTATRHESILQKDGVTS